jgi:hypothetical protein
MKKNIDLAALIIVFILVLLGMRADLDPCKKAGHLPGEKQLVREQPYTGTLHYPDRDELRFFDPSGKWYSIPVMDSVYILTTYKVK